MPNIKEIQADAMAIENSFTTLADVAASQGRNWRDDLKQRKRELLAMQAEGLTLPVGGDALVAPDAPPIVPPTVDA